MEKEGTLRLLTPGEVRMARAVFGDAIEYHKVWVHHDSYFPFGLQPDRLQMENSISGHGIPMIFRSQTSLIVIYLFMRCAMSGSEAEE